MGRDIYHSKAGDPLGGQPQYCPEEWKQRGSSPPQAALTPSPANPQQLPRKCQLRFPLRSSPHLLPAVLAHNSAVVVRVGF
jgi:hypothetical protein